jgi:hypothetical protein
VLIGDPEACQRVLAIGREGSGLRITHVRDSMRDLVCHET